MKANRKLAHGLRIAKSSIDGKGCFAAIYFRQNQQIAEYVGERITFAEAECRRRAPGKSAYATSTTNGPLTEAEAVTALSTLTIRATRIPI